MGQDGAARSEDPRADFADFVAASGHRLLQTAVLMSGSRADAQDALQDVLERLYVVWPRVDEPLSYARRMVVNQCSNKRRGQARRREVPLGEATGAVAGDEAAARAESSEIIACLRRLPARQRAVIVLRYFEGLSEAEIAEVLGCSRGSVKTHASRGLKSLGVAIAGPTYSGGRTHAD